MKKYISAIVIALTAITMTSCDKKVDVAAVSAILPGIELSSLGMITPGPYVLPTGSTVSTIQVVFGATTTNKATGAFDVLVTDVSVTPNVTAVTLHFNNWSTNDTFNTTSAGSISYVTVPSSYPNTTIYQGSIILKYGATSPFVTGHSYTVKATAYSSDYTTATASTTSSTFTVAKLFSIQ